MKPFHRFIFFWLFLFLFLFFFFNNFFGKNITGYIPFTGIVKEDVTQSIISSTLNISFDLYKNKIYRLWDLSFWMDFQYDSSTKSRIFLEYLVLDSEGNLVYSDSESFLLEKSSKVERNLDTLQVHGLNLDPGDYIFILKTEYLGKVESFKRKFEIEKISEFLYSLKQLFDISLVVDLVEFTELEDFSARVIFDSFGTEPTPVNLTFLIYDSEGHQVYRKTNFLVVETEKIFVENFEDLEIEPGKYLLVLRTLYNINVEDYFEKPFEYKKNENLFPFVLAGIIVFLALFFIFQDKLLKKKRK